MTIEWTVTIGGLITSAITLLGFVIASFGFFFALRASIDKTGTHLELLAGRILNVENEIKELTRTFAVIASQDARITAQGERLDRIQGEISAWIHQARASPSRRDR